MNVVLATAPVNKRRPIKPQWIKGGLITKELLSDMYLTMKMSSVDIGKHFDVTPETVCNKIKSLGIPLRPFADQLIGQKFGRWTVIKEIGRNKRGCALWLCHCDCGAYGKQITSVLKNGASKSCGCLAKDSARARKGKNHPSYKGRSNKEGYIQLLDHNHPNANKRGRVLEHTAVMAKYLGRPIMPNETIHHKNGIRDDNRLENLELWNGKHTPGVRMVDMVEFCIDYLKRYAPEKLVKEELCESN